MGPPAARPGAEVRASCLARAHARGSALVGPMARPVRWVPQGGPDLPALPSLSFPLGRPTAGAPAWGRWGWESPPSEGVVGTSAGPVGLLKQAVCPE